MCACWGGGCGRGASDVCVRALLSLKWFHFNSDMFCPCAKLWCCCLWGFGNLLHTLYQRFGFCFMGEVSSMLRALVSSQPGFRVPHPQLLTSTVPLKTDRQQSVFPSVHQTSKDGKLGLPAAISSSVAIDYQQISSSCLECEFVAALDMRKWMCRVFTLFFCGGWRCSGWLLMCSLCVQVDLRTV